MDEQIKKEFQSIKVALKDRPTTEKVRQIVKSEVKALFKTELKDRPTTLEVQNMIQKALLPYATRDEVREIIRQELKGYATKKDLEKFASKEDFKKLELRIKEMGLEIVDAIERMMPEKADKRQVDALENRVSTIETKLSLT